MSIASDMVYCYLVICLILAGCADPSSNSTSCPPNYSADPWIEADHLFKRDLFWIGGDGGYSIDLGEGRVLWLFGDSIIDPSGKRSRNSPETVMVSNTVAIQDGYDPSTSGLRFYWHPEPNGTPEAFFPDENGDRFWPGHGIKMGDRLILFLMRVKSTTSGFGFEVYDWDAVLVRNPDDDPNQWDMTRLETPENELQVIAGSASVLIENEYVYAFSSREPSGGDVYLVRWPVQDVYDGELDKMEWWGESAGWKTDESAQELSTPVLLNGGTEFTVHREPESECYLQVQTSGFGSAFLTLRSANRLTGPWPAGDTLYQPPEFDKDRIIIYQGKAHPHLAGADLILTYSTNSFDFDQLLADSLIYFPRFVRLSNFAAASSE